MNALESLHDASRTGKREQTILTPTWLTDNLIREWGFIAMDPCSDDAGTVPARVHVRAQDREHGLVRHWLSYTYANVPFGRLKDWLAHAVKQLGPTALLAPVRTHRRWYREAVRGCSAVIEFDAFAFQGFKSTFPAPLALLCWGWVPDPEIWKGRGDVLTR